jgi:aldose 1-epimerase
MPGMSHSNTMSKTIFDAMPDGREIHQFVLVNGNGVRVSIIELGAIITSIITPDRDGRPADIVLGHESCNAYLERSPYFGAVVGRYANRIANARFKLDGATYTLATKNGPNHLHGGTIGFDKRLWHGEWLELDGVNSVRFSRNSPDGEENYPGDLNVGITYSLDESNRLTLDYQATTSARTIINLSQHSYFNLGGHDGESIVEHELRIGAEFFTPVDKTMIPTGEILSVSGSPFDFRTAKPIGRDIEQSHTQLEFGLGYDHNFVLTAPYDDGLRAAAELFDPKSGRQLRLFTDQPGLQFYTGNKLDGSITGKSKVRYHYRGGLCLETQHFPNSPNVAHFPSTVLQPGNPFRSRTVFEFNSR